MKGGIILIKFIAFIIVLLYIIAPFSICPGPFDEIILFVVDISASILFSSEEKD